MSEEEKLVFFLEKLKLLAEEKIQLGELTALNALKEALHYIEGDMQGY